MRFQLPYSKTDLTLEVADRRLAGVLESGVNTYRSGLSETALVERALDETLGSPGLAKLLEGCRDVVIISSDHTRPVPSHITMPILLRRIREAKPGIQIRILVATGFHRASTHEELEAKYGAEIVANEAIVMHDSQDTASLANAGTLPSGGELWLNRTALETDLLIAEGFIEPHFFAGFSGGRKSVLPGVAGAGTIMANHCAEFISDPQARTGSLEGNPIHADMLYAARQAKLAFILNVVLNEKKQIIHAVAGDCDAAHRAGCEFLIGLSRVQSVPADIVVSTNGGYPLDQNIYQAVKGMTAAEASCRPGGVIIMVAACNDGHGGQSFYDNLAEAPSPCALLKRIQTVPRAETVPDQWEFQILARILSQFRVILVSDQCDPEMIRAMHMHPAASLREAFALAEQWQGPDATVTVIPDGVSVIVK